MKHQWYGDNRDIVKWGTLIRVCKRYGLRKILHAAMLTRDRERERLKCNGDFDCAIFDEVWEHFRNITDIKRLGEKCGMSIEIFDQEFTHFSRQIYFDRLLETIRQQNDPLVVFLDPDTGIAPGTLKKEHISREEIRNTWHAIKPSECLVLYQHAWRDKHWKSFALKKFKEACGATNADMYDSQIAPDVVFLAARKT